MATPDTVRRSKRVAAHEDTEDELAVKIPRIEELVDEDEKRSRASSVSPGIGGLTFRRESRGGQDKPAELFRKDLISAMKLADTEQLQPEDYVTITDHWKQEWETGVQVPVNPSATIHRTVVVKKVDGYQSLRGHYGFKLPKKFLHATADDGYKQGIHELHDTQKLADQMCRYDLDDLDLTWLHKCNEEREAMGLEPIAEWVMEKVVEELENQCYSNMQKTIKTVEGLGIEYDENVVCDVCRNPEGEDNNEIVFCDGCDICVHQACYGIKNIPEGSWLCRTCALGIQPKCILCPKTGGAMKSTKSGTKWAHVSCALWIPEVSIGCPEKMEPITKISQIPSSRWSLICNICRERSGACIQCSVKTCKTAFHVTCAFNNNLLMKTILDEDHDDVQLKAHCTKHSGKKSKEGETSPRKDPGTPKRDLILRGDLATPTKRECEMTEEEKTELRSHRLSKLAEEFYCCVEVPEVAEACKMPEELVDFICSYWVLKRKSNFNKPLLTPKTEEADLLLRQREDSLVARMKMFIHLRQDLERVRNLCYMVSKREKVRRHLYSLKEEVFRQQAAMLDKLRGSQAQTREYRAIVGAHREPATIYDQYDALLRVAKIDEQKSRLEEDTCSELDDSEPLAKLHSKQRRSAVRDTKRRLAFTKAVAGSSSGGRKEAGKSVETRTSNLVITSSQNSSIEQMKSPEPSRRRGRTSPNHGQYSQKSHPETDEEIDVTSSPKSRMKRHSVSDTLSPGKKSKISPASRSVGSTKERATNVTPEKQTAAAGDKPSPPKTPPCDPSQWLRRSTRTHETLPQEVEEFIKQNESSDEFYGPLELSLENRSPKPKSAPSSPAKSTNSTPTKKTSPNAGEGKCSKSQGKSDKLCDSPSEKSTEQNNFSPKKTRRSIQGKQVDGTSSSSSLPKSGKNGQSLPHVEVSVDESSGKISLHVRKHSEPVNLKQNTETEYKRSPRKISTSDKTESVSMHRHSLDSSVLQKSRTKEESKFRTPKRTSVRVKGLGINGLVSPSQLVVKQDIKDKVERSLGRLRSRHLNHKHLENGIVDSSQRKMDKLLAARKNSITRLDDSPEIIDPANVYTKENNPTNGSHLNNFRPISLDVHSPEKSKKMRVLSSPKLERNSPVSRASLTSVSTSGRSTPETRRSLRSRTSAVEPGVEICLSPNPDKQTDSQASPGSMRTSRTPVNGLSIDHPIKSRSSRGLKSMPIIINASDSEDSVNVPFTSDSEYAASEGSISSDNSRKLRSQVKVITVDEASRDSNTSSVRSSSRLSGSSRNWSKVVSSLQS